MCRVAETYRLLDEPFPIFRGYMGKVSLLRWLCPGIFEKFRDVFFSRKRAHTSTAPPSLMASLVLASPRSILLCGSPDGIIGKQFSCFSTRQSKITGPS